MEVETDHLRRNSRAHVESPLISTNPAFQFESQGESSNTSRSRGKMRMADISTPLPENETPQLKRNKHLRNNSNGRGKRISSSFEATGVLCEFTSYSMQISAETFLR
jgi:kinetochore protein Mis13/DSN1